jgi:hypothetical protein
MGQRLPLPHFLTALRPDLGSTYFIRNENGFFVFGPGTSATRFGSLQVLPLSVDRRESYRLEPAIFLLDHQATEK